MITIQNSVKIVKEGDKTPVDDISEILSSYLFKNTDRIADINVELDYYKHKIYDKYQLTTEEKKELEFKIIPVDTDKIVIKTFNIFTAAIMFGYFKPLVLISSKYFLINADNTLIYYHISSDSFLHDKSKKVDYIELMKDHSLLHKFMCKLTGISIAALQQELQQKVTEVGRQSMDRVVMAIFNNEFNDIPEHAVEIKPGKSYRGRGDGEFEIRTIGNYIWFIPGICVEIEEIE